jgi:hypothetical protein
MKTQLLIIHYRIESFRWFPRRRYIKYCYVLVTILCFIVTRDAHII